MDKNNKKTMNERTHNSLDLYKHDKNNEEFAAEFDSKEKTYNNVPNKNKNQQPSKYNS